ncbi:MAG: hypothetical protein GY855_15060 [candidate division Zixibacteria bacterium]|nr:hypothetical protein [candidate division Zixibacteria bacterium]
MNSKIEITFNQVPNEDTVLNINDAAFSPSGEKSMTFKSIRTKVGESNRSGSVLSTASAYRSLVNHDYPNTDHIVTRVGAVVTIESTNPLSLWSVVSNTTGGAITTNIINSTGSGAPTELPVGYRTDINDAAQITFANSPIHLRLQNAAKDATIEQAYVYLWVWNGAQNKVLGDPNRTLFKKSVSASDPYINFQIADYIKAFIENPTNAPNTNQPNFAYNQATDPAITGMGVFWQVIFDITSNGSTVRTNSGTNFATLGYRWNYEQNLIANNGLSVGGSTGFIQSNDRWYNDKIHHYISQSYKLDNLVADATVGNMITTQIVTPPAAWKRCSRDSSLIVYLDKLGLWDMFTPHGKIVASSDVDASKQRRAYRDPSQIDNTYTHSTLKANPDIAQGYVINSGSLTETMISQIEEVIYSPKIYLILFKGDVHEGSTVGITIDDTNVTIDDTNITIDSATVPLELEGQFKSFQQIPVISKDRKFTRKTRVNDKNKIDYNFNFEETNNKRLDIR